jgi:hypothetical protein
MAGCTTASLTNGLLGLTRYRNNAVAAGIPANFFVANPDLLGGAYLTTNHGQTRAHSVQVEFRKRMTKGLAYNASYTWSNAELLQRYGYQRPAEWIPQAGQVGNVQHALKGNWIFNLPFGSGQRYGTNATGLTEKLIGGWSFDGVARIQTGEQLQFGNVRLVGMDKDELQKAISVRTGAGGQVFVLPDDIVLNTVRAFAVSPTSPTGYGAQGPPTGRYLAPANGPDCIETVPGYGDCGLRSLVVNGPSLVRFDLSVVKMVRIAGDVTFEFRAEMLNAFNQPYFNPASAGGTPLGLSSASTNAAGPAATGSPIINPASGNAVDSYRMTTLLGDNQSRLIQLVFRVRF